MEPVTVSPKFQVVIPAAIRSRLGIKSGQKLRVIAIDGRIELLPYETPANAYGFLRGLNTDVPREPDRL